MVVKTMASQIVLLVVFLALIEFASSIENKRETCRCRSESSKTGCKTGEEPNLYSQTSFHSGYHYQESYNFCPTDEIVISNRRVGSVPNKIRSLYAYGGPSASFPERFRLIELESPIKLGENPQTSFQPGCFLKELREAKRTVYRNLR